MDVMRSLSRVVVLGARLLDVLVYEVYIVEVVYKYVYVMRDVLGVCQI